MAFDTFLKIDGGNIEGESTDAGHEGWVEVLSYSWGVDQPTSASASSGGSMSAERANFDDFTIIKAVDNTSPQLYLSCSNGTHLEKLRLEVCRSGGDKQLYAAMNFIDVVVCAARPSGMASGSEQLPTEEISFRYGRVEWEYFKTDVAGGAAGGVNSAHWDLKTNQGG